MWRGSVVPCAIAAVLAAGPRTAAGQGTQGWSAQLVLSPLPSPYLSDWEVDPTIGELIVTNSTATTTDVTFHYTLTRDGHLLLRGVTDPQTVPAGQSETFNGSSTFGGSADWDRDVQDLVTRTGRLPEGDYEACVTITDPGGFVLVERQCVQFSAQYPEPPSLVFPMNGDTITTQDPTFEWLPVDLPPLAGGRLGYVLQIAEVNTAAGQRPETALESNIPHYVEPDLVGTSQQYPVGALPFVSGRTYAWCVQALDGDGLPVAANQGRSEVWTFVYAEPAVDVDRPVASIALTPRRDTLRYAGDTTLFEAQAFDADNVVIPGKRFQWRSADTAVARVDSAGVVTGVGAGETHIVASVDGVADSASSVTAAASALAVHFEDYDAATEKPSLLELIESGSYDEVVPQLMALLQTGDLRIPIPRIAALHPGEAGGSGPSSAPGPLVGDGSQAFPTGACSGDASAGGAVHADPAKKVWVIQFAATEWRTVTRDCIGSALGNDTAGVDTTFHQSVLFAVSWAQPGVPRVFLAFKDVAGVPLPLGGTAAHVRYLVINPLRKMSLGSDILPAVDGGFFGSESFDAGVGVTYYAKRTCVDPAKWLCQILTGINPDNPDITISGFAGVTASEINAGSGGPGASVALGFIIQASLPVRRLDFDIGGLSIDSSQVGLQFAVQDSVVGDSLLQGTGQETYNQSIDVGPVLAIWLSTVHNTDTTVWEVDGSAALEWDPGANEALKPKLVVSAQLAQTWQLSVVRLGNPALVFTTPIGGRAEREATTLALSGAWGFGPANGFGIADSSTGFEEMGRGQITFSWARPPAPLARDAAKRARDSAIVAVTRQLHVVHEAQEREASAKVDVGLAHEGASQGTPSQPCAPGSLCPGAGGGSDAQRQRAADSAYAVAKKDLDVAQATLDRLRLQRDAARDAAGPPKCWKTVRDRCLNWSARLSVGPGALRDLFVQLDRILTGTQ